jgi:hypothetical protein
VRLAASLAVSAMVISIICDQHSAQARKVGSPDSDATATALISMRDRAIALAISAREHPLPAEQARADLQALGKRAGIDALTASGADEHAVSEYKRLVRECCVHVRGMENALIAHCCEAAPYMFSDPNAPSADTTPSFDM